MLNPYRLGASLYVPGTCDDLLEIAEGRKWPGLRSVIFCTEDAVAAKALPHAIANLRHALERLSPQTSMLRFVRVRDPRLLGQLIETPGADKLDGFVFPKVERGNIDTYMAMLAGTNWQAMPTLETRDAFDQARMTELRDHLLTRGYDKQILALRIGGNDLLSILSIRRPRDRTIYRTPIGHTIAQLVTIFKPHGFQLTAPVFEHLDRPDLLREELEEDLAHGLCGKTAIHPQQVPLIEAAHQVSPTDLEAARRILDDERPVFKFGGSMCEVATHSSWANRIVEQATVQG